ncbi:MAG TPA: complex I NDUFA9 subunit family protein [Rhodobacteraceae bacterium]|nr:complex I NDUFA9 subunit family protein [Paracoccaceae bacterium]
MSKLVTIYGGSGFLGRYIASRMARAGWRVRVAVRRPNQALFVRTYGTVGQVEPVLCNVRDDASVAEAMRGADAVVYSVGVLNELGRNTFDATQHEGAERVARLAAQQGVGRLVHISAIGADSGSKASYARTKRLGEEGVLEHFPDVVILRPSILFGPEDDFFNRFAGMAVMSPVLPVAGAETKFQPVYVDDVAAAAELGVKGKAAAGIYELGGPEIKTFRELLQTMLEVIQRNRLIVNLPFGAAKFFAWWFDLWQKLSGGLIKAPLTVDQVKNLSVDNVVAPDAKGFDDLGIDTTAMAAVLPDYLYRFRVAGQYAAITASAKNLKT